MKRKIKTFIPPNFSLPVLWFIDRIHAPLLKKLYNIQDIIISDEDRKLLRSFREERLIYFSNHPTTAEPAIAYHISKVMGARFNYLAGREVFNWNHGINGFLLSRIGAYSIVQGAGDRESMKMTRDILASPGGKLVLFPEGAPTSGENDSLMPFQSGVAQLGLWGFEDARKNDPQADIWILSAFVKYKIRISQEEALLHLTSSIGALERQYELERGDRTLLRRFLHFGRILLEKTEKEYNIPEASETDFDYRVGRIRHAILDGVADRMGIELRDNSLDAIQKLRHILGIVEMLKIDYPLKGLPQVSRELLDWAVRECAKAYDFIVIKKDYLTAHPSAERFYEWLIRFESIVFGKQPRALGGLPWPVPVEAHVRLASPFKISEYHSADKKEKRAGVEKMLARLRDDMQNMLDLSMESSPPLFFS